MSINSLFEVIRATNIVFSLWQGRRGNFSHINCRADITETFTLHWAVDFHLAVTYVNIALNISSQKPSIVSNNPSLYFGTEAITQFDSISVEKLTQ